MLRPVILHGDNINANSLANNTASSSRTRHIALRERFVSEKALDGLVNIVKISSAEQIADIFTKPVRKDVLRKHSISLGLGLPELAMICMICAQSFESNNLLHKHLRTHDSVSLPVLSSSPILPLSASSTSSF